MIRVVSTSINEISPSTLSTAVAVGNVHESPSESRTGLTPGSNVIIGDSLSSVGGITINKLPLYYEYIQNSLIHSQ